MKATREKRLSGAQILIETLAEQGVRDVFGYPGGQVVDIYDALFRAKGRIRHILTAHEQGAAHAADGYARATGKVGVVIATSGPGATNLVTGIATAMLDSVPMVAITGNVATSLIGKDAFQEVNITGITLPITKHNYFVQDVRELADTIREAFRIAKSGRPGPVLVDIPKDVQLARCPYKPQPAVLPFPEPTVADSEIDRAVALLEKAERPYLYIGGGAAANELGPLVLELAEKLDGYIGCSLMGLSAVPRKHMRVLGMQGMHGDYASTMANNQADLILAVGVRFSDRATGNVDKFCKNTTIIQLDTDQAEINKNVPVTLGLVGDIRKAFEAILACVKPQQHPAWQQTVKALKKEQKAIAEKAKATNEGRLSPQTLFEIINRHKAPDSVVATDVGQHQMWTAQNIDLKQPRTFVTSGGLGTMGFGLGAAIGAAVATGKQTFLITGDGSFGMNLNELATAVTYRIPLVIVLCNNGVLGMVRQWQTMFFGKRYSATSLSRKTDYVRLCEAFGASAQRVSDPASFEQALETALKKQTPYLIEVEIDKDELVLPMLRPDGSIDEIITE